MASECLKDCFECTDWAVLLGTTDEECMECDIDSMMECTTDYINFCRDIVVPEKSVCCFPNNKPCITSNIEGLLN